jgi:hypothetical protein
MAAAIGRGTRATRNGARAGVVPAEQARGMNGLDIMQALLEGRFPYPPIAETPEAGCTRTRALPASCSTGAEAGFS